MKAKNKTRIRRLNKLDLWKKNKRKGDLMIARETLALCEKMGWLEDHPVMQIAKEVIKKYGNWRATDK